MKPLLIAAAVACSLALAACGTADENAADTTNGDHSQHDGSSSGSAPDDTGEMDGMVTLAQSTEGDLQVELHAMPPERFFVSEGDRMREQVPSGEDDAHLMVTLADAESGVRLPDATVTARVIDSQGATAFEGPLYPMVGRGMGLHYGENVAIGEPGEYTIELTIGPPRIGRHRAVAKAWSKTRKIEQRVRYDGTSLAEA